MHMPLHTMNDLDKKKRLTVVLLLFFSSKPAFRGTKGVDSFSSFNASLHTLRLVIVCSFSSLKE